MMFQLLQSHMFHYMTFWSSEKHHFSQDVLILNMSAKHGSFHRQCGWFQVAEEIHLHRFHKEIRMNFLSFFLRYRGIFSDTTAQALGKDTCNTMASCVKFKMTEFGHLLISENVSNLQVINSHRVLLLKRLIFFFNWEWVMKSQKCYSCLWSPQQCVKEKLFWNPYFWANAA